MAAELFVDTSAWFPLARPSHPDHARVARALRERVTARTRIVTTNLIVAESHALLLIRAGRAPALQFLKRVGLAPNEVVHSDADIEARARTHWLERYDDQSFSFADAVSFEVMRARHIREALTLDAHFASAGYTMVPGN